MKATGLCMKKNKILSYLKWLAISSIMLIPAQAAFAQETDNALKPQGFAAYVPAILIILGVVTILLGVLYYFTGDPDYWSRQ